MKWSSYCSTASWSDRRRKCGDEYTESDPDFGPARLTAVDKSLQGQSPLHVIANLGAEALLGYLAAGCIYKTCYEQPVIGGTPRTASPRREKVDGILGIDGRVTRFAAVAFGGTGMRFYGEYVLALGASSAASVGAEILDRNSYHFLEQPLSLDPEENVRRLRGDWSDRQHIVSLKVLQRLELFPRLPTAGAIAAAVLDDEDYVEVLWHGNFERNHVSGVREAAQDVALEASINDRAAAARMPLPEEIIWAERRQRVRDALDANSIPLTTVMGNGRTGRWG
jgi:hypothetical protein